MAINGIDSNSVRYAESKQAIKTEQGMKEISLDFATGNYNSVNRKEMADKGRAQIFDHANNTRKSVETTNKNQSLLELRLSEQETAIKQIDKIFLDFEVLINKPGREALGTDEQIANEALDKIEKILNKKIDGRYVFGGQDTSTKPLLHKLSEKSNIINGQVMQNYTKAVASKGEVVVDAEQTTLKASHICASTPLIAKVIGAINIFKTDGRNDDYTKISNEVHEGVSATQYVLDLDKKTLEESAAINSSYDSISQDILQNFYGSMITGQQRLQEAMTSFKMTSDISTAVGRTVNQSLLQTLGAAHN